MSVSVLIFHLSLCTGQTAHQVTLKSSDSATACARFRTPDRLHQRLRFVPAPASSSGDNDEEDDDEPNSAEGDMTIGAACCGCG